MSDIVPALNEPTSVTLPVVGPPHQYPVTSWNRSWSPVEEPRARLKGQAGEAIHMTVVSIRAPTSVRTEPLAWFKMYKWPSTPLDPLAA